MGVVRKQAVAFAAAVVLLTAALGAASVNPWSGTPSAATEVAPADASGVNVLEPVSSYSAPAAVKAPQSGNTERAVGEWNPTGGGGGGGGSPKG
jgi:hypothetical protein